MRSSISIKRSPIVPVVDGDQKQQKSAAAEASTRSKRELANWLHYDMHDTSRNVSTVVVPWPFVDFQLPGLKWIRSHLILDDSPLIQPVELVHQTLQALDNPHPQMKWIRAHVIPDGGPPLQTVELVHQTLQSAFDSTGLPVVLVLLIQHYFVQNTKLWIHQLPYVTAARYFGFHVGRWTYVLQKTHTSRTDRVFPAVVMDVTHHTDGTSMCCIQKCISRDPQPMSHPPIVAAPLALKPKSQPLSALERWRQLQQPSSVRSVIAARPQPADRWLHGEWLVLDSNDFCIDLFYRCVYHVALDPALASGDLPKPKLWDVTLASSPTVPDVLVQKTGNLIESIVQSAAYHTTGRRYRGRTFQLLLPDKF